MQLFGLVSCLSAFSEMELGCKLWDLTILPMSFTYQVWHDSQKIDTHLVKKLGALGRFHTWFEY